MHAYKVLASHDWKKGGGELGHSNLGFKTGFLLPNWALSFLSTPTLNSTSQHRSPMQSSMPVAQITLTCLIEGDSSPFIVEPKEDISIMKLKKLIHEERKNGVLGSVDALFMDKIFQLHYADILLWLDDE